MTQASAVRPRDQFGILVLSLAWAGSYLLFRLLVVAVPPITIAASRVLVGALLLHAILAARGRLIGRPAGGWHAFLVMGALNNALPFVLIISAARHLNAGLLAILLASTPAFTALLAHLVGAIRLTAGRAIGVGLGFCGVAVLVGPDALAGGDVLAELGVLGAALSYAVAGLYGRRFARAPALDNAAGQLSAASLILCAIAAVIDQPWGLPPLSAANWWELAALAIPCTGLPFILFFTLLARIGPANVLLVTFLSPVSTLIMAALLLGEPIGLRALAGMAIIALGLAAIDGRLLHHVTQARVKIP